MPKLSVLPFKFGPLGPKIVHVLQALIVIGVVVEGWLLSQTSPAKENITLATTKQAEVYTELYFVNPTHLPRLVTARKSATFSYRLVNHHINDITYRAYISIVENGTTRLLGVDTTQVNAGQTKDVIVPFTTSQPGTRLQLIVDIPAERQTIHFNSQS